MTSVDYVAARKRLESVTTDPEVLAGFDRMSATDEIGEAFASAALDLNISFNWLLFGKGSPTLDLSSRKGKHVAAKSETLPGNSRECCRLIREALEPLDDWPIGALPEDFPGLVRALCEGEPDYLEDARGALNALAGQARDAGRAYRVAFRRIAELSSHGTRDLPSEPENAA